MKKLCIYRISVRVSNLFFWINSIYTNRSSRRDYSRMAYSLGALNNVSKTLGKVSLCLQNIQKTFSDRKWS